MIYRDSYRIFMRERIQKLMLHYKLKQGAFANKIGVSAQTISDILSGKKKAGEKVNKGIMEAFEGEVNPLWVLGKLDDAYMLFTERNDLKEFVKTTDALQFKTMEELAFFCARHEDELMQIKVFSNIVEKHAALMALHTINKAKY